MATRRTLLKGLAAAVVLPARGWAGAGRPDWVAAARRPDGRFSLHGIAASGNITFSVPLPARGHAAAAHPHRAEAVAFARRPGAFGIVLDCIAGRETKRLTLPETRRFNGHGAYSADGKWLYTSEIVTQTSAGRVGIWSVSGNYTRVGEWDSGGIGPHELRLMPDGCIVVANGGIRTDPEDRRKLNLDDMSPNLTILDEGGNIVSTRALPTALRRNSIRHLALLPEGVAFAMQWQGETTEAVPLLGLAPRQAELTAPPLPADEAYAMQGYAGSIAANDTTIALTSPRGGVAMLFDLTGRHLQTLHRPDLCGAAPAPEGGFALTDGGGAVWAADTDGLRLRAKHDLAWDNHLVRL